MPTLHGEEFGLFFRDGSGPYEAKIWEPYQKEAVPWITLIDSVRGVGTLVPRRFVVRDWGSSEDWQTTPYSSLRASAGWI